MGCLFVLPLWPHAPWDGPRVKAVLRTMKETAAPGTLGIHIALWRSMPDSWMAAVARLLTLVEEAGCWPTEWLDAYVTMLPKSAGGTRPPDQRPITVLDVLYRMWSKGVVLEWTPVLQRDVLGAAAMGFRTGTSTIPIGPLHPSQHVAVGRCPPSNCVPQHQPQQR